MMNPNLAADMRWLGDLVGFYGFFVTISVLFVHMVQLPWMTGLWDTVGFVGGVLISDTTNKTLKTWVRDPRPSGAIPMILPRGWPGAGDDGTDMSMYHGPEQFGYPSGHAQLSFYVLGFFYGLLRGRITIWWLVCVFVSLMTLYQRWSYRRHTVEQLLAGAVLGSGLGLAMYYVTQWVRRWILGMGMPCKR